jgi:TolB-like protein/predicted TPR repeat methyltransferase
MAWLVMQVADVILNNVEAPAWVFHVLMLFLAIGFVFALFFSWAFEMTPEGLKREKDVDRSQSITQETGQKLNHLITGILILALAYFAFDKFVLSASREAALVKATEKAAEQAIGAQAEAPTPAESPEKSIAVLPFVNLSSDPEQEFFSDGLSEELLNLLAQFPGLRVAARTSSFQFKGQNQDIADIAQTLKVAHILEGSVRKSGNKLRITAQLIQADNGYHLWSKTYDRELTDVFLIQDEISAAIGDALNVELALGEGPEAAHRPLVIEAANPQAFEAYLRGRQLINRRGRESIEEAVRSLEKSLRLDSEYAPAHAQLAIATALLMRNPSSYGDLTLDEVVAQATPHAQKAITLAPDLAEAHGALAILALDRLDYPATLEHTRRALELNPSYIDAMNWQYLAVAALGRYEEMRAALERMLDADPLTVVGRLNYMNVFGYDQRFTEGHAIADELLSQSPWASYVGHGQIAMTYEGKVAEGLQWWLRAFAADPGDSFSNMYFVRAFNYIGLHHEARRASDDLAFFADLAAGRMEHAIAGASQRVELDPENPTTVLDYANVLHFAGHTEESLPLYEQLLAMLPGRPIQDLMDGSPEATLRLALARRDSGDEGAAVVAMQLAARDIEERFDGQAVDQFAYRGRAMLAALQNDLTGVNRSIRAALDHGLRDPQFFQEPVFAGLQDDVEFTALQEELEAMLAIERTDVLQLICHNNPVPGAWQPLAATCEGAASMGSE